jgi:hypothetical protein
MSTQKILQINPELFKFNNGKKNSKKKERKVKPRDDKTNTIKTGKLKKELLKRVKDYQKNKELETHNGEKIEAATNMANATNLFNKNEIDNSDFEREFNKSLTFLHDLSKKRKEKRNKTLKTSNIDVNIEIPKDSNIYNNVKQPSYSCLKNGSKPTLKDLNKTQKNSNNGSEKRVNIDLNNNKCFESKPSILDDSSNIETQLQIKPQEIALKPQEIAFKPQEIALKPQEIALKPQEIAFKPQEIALKPIKPDLKTEEITLKPIVYSYSNEPVKPLENNTNTPISEIVSTLDSNDDIYIPKINRVTRTYKYTLGKKNGARHIGLLIKNRDTQKRIKQEVNQLKQQPIQEIKNHLRNKNLIKLGSQAPNDVLRKLYEDSILAGEVTNENTSNLVYNFIN